MHLEALESRALMSADPHGVTLPLHSTAEGNLADNLVTGHSTHMGRWTAAFNDQGIAVFTTASGDEIWAAPELVPTSDPNVVRAVGNYVGGTGRFAGTTGTFSVELIYVNDQGDFVYQFEDTITFQRPWNGQ